MSTKKKQKGFTLIELLATLGIIITIIGISGFSANCYLNSMDNSELQRNASILTNAIDSYVIDRGEMPIGDTVNPASLDIDVTENIIGLFQTGDKEKVLKEEFIHTISTELITSKNVNLTEEEINDFYVLYIPYIDITNLEGTQLEKAQEQNKLASRYNGTLIVKSYVNTCTNKEFTYLKGKNEYRNDLQTSTQYEIPKSYINCPNGMMSDSIDEACTYNVTK